MRFPGVGSGRWAVPCARCARPTPARAPSCSRIPIPEPGEGEVLVRVHAASICGTDLHIYDWNEWAEPRGSRACPMTFGHEVAGWVEAVGPEVHHVQPGAFVAAETHIACGLCSTCRTGRAHICREPADPRRRHRRRVRRVRRDPGRRTRGSSARGSTPTSLRSWSRSATPCTPTFGTEGGEDLAHEPGGRDRVRSDRAVRRRRSRGRSARGRCSRSSRTTSAARSPAKMGADLLIDPEGQRIRSRSVLRETDGIGAEVVLEMSRQRDARSTRGRGCSRAAGGCRCSACPTGR